MCKNKPPPSDSFCVLSLGLLFLMMGLFHGWVTPCEKVQLPNKLPIFTMDINVFHRLH
jgi:hypothetical protein